jgi:membrane carboxypeptidase/penicillin-binding protein PbpC
MNKKFIKKLVIFLTGAFLTLIILVGVFLFWSFRAKETMLNFYRNGESVLTSDRSGKTLLLKPNDSTYYARYDEKIPQRFIELLLKKEDKYFYFHPGFNPVSIIRAGLNFFKNDGSLSSSTITQQLAKILLKNELNRSFKSKLEELAYALALEIHFSKAEILKMYANSAYFGNRVQGIKLASQLYFNASPDLLSDQEIAQLLATLSNPTYNNPFEFSNLTATQSLARRLGVRIENNEAIKNEKKQMQIFSNFIENPNYFDIKSSGVDCFNDCQLTVDEELTGKIREIVKRNIESLAEKNVDNGAVTVIRTGSAVNELLATVGSPDPSVDDYGYKINMAAQPRPIGSTIKPFIYLKGFESGLRPYTKVEDREYKYQTGMGFAFYPKNYDYTYHGEVDLHYALDNSLNVPAVKVLEYVGLEKFYNFLEKDLHFKPLKNLNEYQLGIALGLLDMDLNSLTYYFSIFPEKGFLKPLKICSTGTCGFKGMADFTRNALVGKSEDVALVNKIISDRQTGSEEFGAKSDLNLAYRDYAVKTGTSADFHDSWTIGFTPDFIVGVWVGNSSNEPMDKVSGQTGAGKIWHEVMQLMLNSEYNRNGKFDFSQIQEFNQNGQMVFGLPNDNFEASSRLLSEDNLILTPYNNDVYLFSPGMRIPLKTRVVATWFLDGKKIGEGNEVIFSPAAEGAYSLEAISSEKKESIKIIIRQDK